MSRSGLQSKTHAWVMCMWSRRFLLGQRDGSLIL
ncbi:hypothetical protein RB2654_15190 [Rhodobacterales bacterium HTCC2654]|uniref:Uncharacterized protein n=1 Tax=Maritimibacter alkaliphilus HTCC2654 TaxID=314271 RepID=A3VH87_9RHOB|nr:hypothetical protein RB2654_15190 [Rhodobacterales bacterium HTCC2654] [Maritimibacter alkaliphilus HTCC2654]